MILHEIDRSFSRLAGCWKRSMSLAPAGGEPTAIDPAHPLAIAWSNCRLYVDGMRSFDKDGPDFAFDLQCLDWFADKLNAFSETHMLAGDASVAQMLREWRECMPINPLPLVAKLKTGKKVAE